jgi:UDP-glucose 4-epimerase
MVNAIDMDNYYRIPSDTRDLNYSKFFIDGEVITEATDYHSHNTKRLNENELKDMILNLYEVQNELKKFGII